MNLIVYSHSFEEGQRVDIFVLNPEKKIVYFLHSSLISISNMYMEIDPPKFHSKKLYEIYRKELMAWSSLTDLPKCKHALVIAYSLPYDESIRHDVFSDIPLVQLHNENGLDILLNFLDKRFLRNGLVDRMDVFEDFRWFTRHEGQSYREYVAMFDRKYMKMKVKKIGLPSEVLVHELLRRSGISDRVKRLILNNIGDGDSDDIYKKVKFFFEEFQGK